MRIAEPRKPMKSSRTKNPGVTHPHLATDPLRFAFDRKSAIHAGLSGKPVPAQDMEVRLGQLLETPRQGPAAAYFHIPFCSSRCTYCGFFSRLTHPQDSSMYTDALIRELRSKADRPAIESSPIQAVYLGGGTPTDLEPRHLLRLLNAIRELLPLSNDCEITLEGRVHGVCEATVEAALRGGVNRFSIGVQSFDTAARRAVGRLDDRETVLRALEYLAGTAQAAVVIDLVYGFPGQTLERWIEDVKTLGKISLDGADLYQLNVLPHTALARLIAEGACPPAATLPEQAVMYSAAVDTMDALGWDRISVSHWRATWRERNTYNRLAKSGATILPFGCGAGGNLHGYRIMQERDFGLYLDRVENGRTPAVMLMAPDPLERLASHITDGFDRGRFHAAKLDAWAGHPVRQALQPLLDQWSSNGLVSLKGDWLHLTRAGEFWHVNLAQALLDRCRDQAPFFPHPNLTNHFQQGDPE